MRMIFRVEKIQLWIALSIICVPICVFYDILILPCRTNPNLRLRHLGRTT